MKIKKPEEIEEETSIPITEEDVILSPWIQEIKDKVLSPVEKGTLQYSLIGLWDLCGNIQDFVKEKQEERAKEICKMIEGLKFKGRFKGIDEETDRAYQKGNNDVLKDIINKIKGGQKQK